MPRSTAKQTKVSRETARAYTLKITLRGSKPPIWRRFAVDSQISLAELHDIIQTVMGWYDCHLHEFVIAGRRYTDPETLDGFEEENLDEIEYALGDVIKRKGARFKYLYDFGDGWEHELLLEEIASLDPAVHYPVCLTGKKACPPEDCGGIFGYYNLLEILKNPKHPEHEDYKEWAGDIDPDVFDITQTNELLKEYRSNRRPQSRAR